MPEVREFKTKVEISGEKYTLVGDTSPEQMSEIVAYVNEIMKKLSERNPKLNRSQVAILAALNVADEMFKLKYEYENIVHMLEPEKNKKKNRNSPNS